MYRLGLTIDPWLDVKTYRIDWQGEGKRKARLPIPCSTGTVPKAQASAAVEACVATVESCASIQVEPGGEADDRGGVVWPDAQPAPMAQVTSGQRVQGKHRCVLTAVLPAREARPRMWMAQVVPVPRLQDMRARVMAASQELPKGVGGAWRQPGVTTQHPGLSAEVLKCIPDFTRGTVVLELFAGMGGGLAGFLIGGGVCTKLIAVEASLTAREAPAVASSC
eukprot:jgi/Mesvir1/4306/Mv06380-RA.1